jgi:hypothetical protein
MTPQAHHGVTIIETVTERGPGRWGHHRYNVELGETVTTWTSSDASREVSVTGYYLACGPPVGRRWFDTALERQAFITGSFTELPLDAVVPPQSRDVEYLLSYSA